VRQTIAILKLLRLQNCLIAAAAVACGRYLTPGGSALYVPWPAMIAISFICAFGNVVNDILDQEADRINHPQRPLPSGIITPLRAKVIAALTLLPVAGVMPILKPMEIVIAGTALVLVIWYNFHLEDTAFWGNLAVSVLCGLTFLLGGAAYGVRHLFHLPGPLIPAIFALLMHFARELIKDIQDREGDRLAGSRTAAVRRGPAFPFGIAICALALLLLLSLFVYVTGWFSLWYLALVIPFVHVPIIAQTWWLARDESREKAQLVATFLKIEMIPGLVALLAGRSFPAG
jgi:geranylgeranylglycerol-phosphate geranylgeranyltransferase